MAWLTLPGFQPSRVATDPPVVAENVAETRSAEHFLPSLHPLESHGEQLLPLECRKRFWDECGPTNMGLRHHMCARCLYVLVLMEGHTRGRVTKEAALKRVVVPRCVDATCVKDLAVSEVSCPNQKQTEVAPKHHLFCKRILVANHWFLVGTWFPGKFDWILLSSNSFDFGLWNHGAAETSSDLSGYSLPICPSDGFARWALLEVFGGRELESVEARASLEGSDSHR